MAMIGAVCKDRAAKKQRIEADSRRLFSFIRPIGYFTIFEIFKRLWSIAMNQPALHFQEFHVNPRRSRRLEILLLTVPVLVIIALAITSYNLDLYKVLFFDETGITNNLMITIWILSIVSIIPAFWLINRRLTRLGRVQISERGLDAERGFPVGWVGSSA